MISMIKKLVIDSSVIIKWLNQDKEAGIAQADKIMSNALELKVELFAPELAKYESGNVLLKGKQLSPREANILLDTLYSLPITFVSESEDLAKDAFLLAYTHNITYYDAAFLSLARQYDATLITDNIKHQGKSSQVKVIALKNYGI